MTTGLSLAKEWSRAVKELDSNTCQDCGTICGIIYAHHIKKIVDHPELRFIVSNGIALCSSCHAKRHPERHIHRLTPRFTRHIDYKIFKCLRCGHDWPSEQERPTICPKCKSPYWDKPKKNGSPE